MKLLRKVVGALNRIAARRDAAGAYRFAVKNWTGINDLNIAAQVVAIEGFDKWLAPQPLPLDGVSSMLVLAPHQDDEAIGAGGTMLLAAQMGTKISILFATDGGPKERKLRKHLYATPQAYVDQRWSEAEQVCAVLGADMIRLGLSNACPDPAIATLDRLSGIIADTRPDVILTPWLLDLRPKHRMMNHLLWLAHRRSGLAPCEIWNYQVNNTLFPNGYVDITEVAERKRSLLRLYQSQITQIRRFDHETLGLNAWNGRFVPSKTATGKDYYLEIFFALPLRAHLEQVEKYYFGDFVRTYLDEGSLAQKMAALHKRTVAESAAR